MTRFQDLLRPDGDSTPALEQERASGQLPDAVRGSHLRWWTSKDAMPTQGTVLLLVVAPYSQYDLALLDVLDADRACAEQSGAAILPKAMRCLGSRSTSKPSLSVYVANVRQYETVAQLADDIPGITQFPPQTPLAAVWENGRLRQTAWGKQGRDLAADTLALSPDKVHLQVIAKVPTYTPPSRRAN